MKKIILLLLSILFSFSINISYGYGGCSSYGIMAIETYNGYCKCMNGYSFGYDILGNKTCISDDTLCQNDYGYGAESTGNGYCGCKSGYIMGLNSLGKKQCNSGYTYCSFTYGINSEFNLLSNSCECKDGYTVKTNYLGNQTCEEKSNSAYFFLSEYDDNNNKALVISYVTKKKYLLELKYKTGLYKAEDFIGKSIVINMGTDFTIDKYDEFVLNNDIKTTDIVTDILYVEQVDEDFTLKTCEDVYGENSEETYDNKCICKNGYQWNYNKTSCELITTNITYNTCLDNVNGFLGTDGKCYCNSGYYWSNSDNKCVKKIIIFDKNQQVANSVFNNIKSKVSSLSENDKKDIYKILLIKIDELKINSNGDILIILDDIKILIQNELNN